jgi:hypothetical protein
LLEQRTLLSTWTVTDNSDSPTDTGSLRHAILNAPSGSTVEFAPTVTGPIVLSNGTLKITKNLDIEGSGAGSLVIDGNNASTVFSVSSRVIATISGLTIAHGSATDASKAGGGIVNSGTLTLNNCAVEGNQAPSGGSGGGIFNSGMLTLNNCAVENNRAPSGDGGGIDNAARATLAMTNCTVSGNTAPHGGGIGNLETMTLTSCTVSNNSAAGGDPSKGGGIYTYGTATLTNCTVAGNSAMSVQGTLSLGGGIYGRHTLTLTNCTVSNNSADSGGGILNIHKATLTGCTISGNSATGVTFSRNSGIAGGILSRDLLTPTNCTVANNFAAKAGGGVYGDEGTAVQGTVNIANCTVAGNSAGSAGGGIDANSKKCTLANAIIAANRLTGSGGTGPDVHGSISSVGFNLIGNPSGSDGWVRTDLQNRNPLLSMLRNYGGATETMALLPGSPAIGTGSPSASIPGVPFPTTDQRGDPRLTAGSLDIGAFQSQGFKITISSGDKQSATVNTAFAAPLVVSVTSAHGEPVVGGFILFTAPERGASSVFSKGIRTAVIKGSGLASINLSANKIAGGPYVVTATTKGDSDGARFSLTNTP